MREQTEYYDFLRLIARQDPWSEHVNFLLLHKVSDKPRAICEPLQFHEVPDGTPIEPTFRLYGPKSPTHGCTLELRVAADTGKHSEGQLKQAVQRHLADMRTIAFGKFGDRTAVRPVAHSPVQRRVR